jgi:hypothetical protein
MVEAVRRTLRERIARGATLDEIDVLIRMSRGLTESDRTSLWAEAWHYAPEAKRDAQVAAARAVMRGGAGRRLH